MLANVISKRVLPTLAALAAISGLIALSVQSTEADHDPGATVVDIVAIDADPTGNTALDIGSTESCVSATAGTPFTIDVVIDQVPDAGISAFGFNLLYDPLAISVLAVNEDQMLLVNQPTNPFLFRDSLPDDDGDFRIDLFEQSGGGDESGEGVLVRLTLDPLASGQTSLALANLSVSEGAYEIANIGNGFIAIDGTCPELTNLSVTAASVTAPANANAGSAFALVVGGTVENQGPAASVNADATASLGLPADCQAAGGSQQTAQDLALTSGSPVILSNFTFNVTCTSPSNHSFTATISVVVDDANVVDVNSGDDSLVSAPSSTAITANSDISATSVTATINVAEVRASMQFQLTVNTTVSNASALGPLPANVQVGITLPADCIIYSPNPRQLPAQIPASGSDVVSTTWFTLCHNPGAHSIALNASVTPGLHVTDTTAGNNTRSGVASFRVKAGVCGPDPTPAGELTQYPSPLLLSTIANLTAGGPEIAAEDKTQLDCQFNYSLQDAYGAGATDCPASSENLPCGMNIGVSMELLGGTPAGPTTRLLPNTVYFIPPEFNWAPDATVANGTQVGDGFFKIRTDAGLAPNEVACSIDVQFDTFPSFEGPIQGAAPDSNSSLALRDPLVWPNDLNGEKFKVEDALQTTPGVQNLQLWSRTVVPLNNSGVHLPLNILTWKVIDPSFSAVVGAEWIFVAFPGDAVNPDMPGPIGGNPDADDPPVVTPQITCAPHAVALSWTGLGSSVSQPLISCNTAGTPLAWGLVDPDAVNISRDEGPRSKVAPCTADSDSDGLTPTAETAFGTNPNDNDTDNDGVEDGPDNCRLVFNPSQADNDSDGLPNECDNCPNASNASQANADGDASGDACDLCPAVATAWVVPVGDSDCDGFVLAVETFTGTLPDDACSATVEANDENGTDSWPVDLDDNQRSNTVDILKYVPGLNSFGPDPPYSQRLDLNGDSRLNTMDILKFVPYLNKPCT